MWLPLPHGLDDRLKGVRKAMRRLTLTLSDAPIARRNARRATLMAIRRLRATMDEHYPAVIVKAKHTKLKTFEGRLTRMKKAGWVLVDRLEMANYASLGIPVRRIEHKRGGTQIGHFVPEWAWAVGRERPFDHVTELRKTKSDARLKRAARVTEALR